MRNVFCIGEALIDMVGKDHLGLQHDIAFEKNAGGAPANVSCAVAKLGAKSYFMGQVGMDAFGDFLIEKLVDHQVDISLMKRFGNTTIAFVSLKESGERDFEFMRGDDKNYILDYSELKIVHTNDIFHFGSAMALLGGNLKKTYTNCVYFAKDNSNFISFDPNYRSDLVQEDGLDRFKKDCMIYISKSDFVKMSEQELCLLTMEEDIYKASAQINDLGARVVCITLGEKGALLSMDGIQEIVPSIKIKQIDSTGAGDAFAGAILYQLSRHEDNIKTLDIDEWRKMVLFANMTGALVCEKYGAIAALPTLEQVNKMISKGGE